MAYGGVGGREGVEVRSKIQNPVWGELEILIQSGVRDRIAHAEVLSSYLELDPSDIGLRVRLPVLGRVCHALSKS